MTTVTCPAIKQDAVVRIVELKNEIGEGGSDPIAQAECDFVLVCSSETVTLFLAALAYTQFPLCSTNHLRMPRAVRCFSLELLVPILLFLVPSSRIDLSRNASRTTSTSGHSLPLNNNPPWIIPPVGWHRFSAHWTEPPRSSKTTTQDFSSHPPPRRNRTA